MAIIIQGNLARVNESDVADGSGTRADAKDGDRAMTTTTETTTTKSPGTRT